MSGDWDWLDDDLRSRLRRGRSEWREPMLATLTDLRFSDENWVFERKLDGVRAIAVRKDGGSTRLWSRTHKPMDKSYPEIIETLDAQGPDDFVADGEIVAFDGAQTSFAALQPRIHLTDARRVAASRVAVYLYLFDLLEVGGAELTGLPLRARKKILRRAFDFDDPLRFSAHRNADGEAYLKEACEQGWEGLVAKRADSTYVRGRSRDWLKLKCAREQELVIGGWTDPAGSREALGALLVGYFEDGRFRYAGKVGTGFNAATLQMLHKRLAAVEQDRSPFADPVPEKRPHWARPELVAQIGFGEWTRDGRLRHPRYLGLRTDKPAEEVVRELPGPAR